MRGGARTLRCCWIDNLFDERVQDLPIITHICYRQTCAQSTAKPQQERACNDRVHVAGELPAGIKAHPQ